MLIGMVELSLITDPVASLSIIKLGSASKEELTTREPEGEIKVPFNKLRFSLSPFNEVVEISQPETFKGADVFVFVNTISYVLELSDVVFLTSAFVSRAVDLRESLVGVVNESGLLPSLLPKQDDRSVHSPRSVIFGAGELGCEEGSDEGAPVTQLPLIFI
jgi:hypothetical protein